MKTTIPGIVVGLGTVLLVSSVAWALLFPASRNWTNEKSVRMGELSQKAHGLLFELEAAKQPKMHGGRSYAEVKAESDQVDAELNELREEFEGNRDSPKKASNILRWSGIAFVAAGAFIIFANRE